MKISMTKEAKAAVKKEINSKISLFRKEMTYVLEYLVADAVAHAKEVGAYNDQTSNLRSSIGGVVLFNGRVIKSKGFKAESNDSGGHIDGLNLVNELIAKHKNGFGIIIVAGMEYASYVEDIHGLDVLETTKLKVRAEMPLMMQKLKDTISKGK